MVKQVITKNEFAQMLGVSNRTLSRWLNIMYYNELKQKYYYKKEQKVLTANQIRFLVELLCYEPE